MVVRSAASVASVCFSAFRAGSLSGLLLRPSSRAFSGVVLVAVFSNHQRAGVFAGRWAARLGVRVSIRRHPAGWAVSVPVALPASRWPVGAGSLLPVRGGVRGLHRLLGWSGLRVCR